MVQKIVPHLWFDKEAKEAAQFYTSAFPDSKITSTRVLHDTPSGDAESVVFQLAGYQFMAISAGPYFKFNPSISFLVACKTIDEVDRLWNTLGSGGKPLMELGEYPFSKKYGWTADKYGLSWQVMLADEHYKFKQLITPSFLFTGAVAGKSEEAMKFYASILPGSAMGGVARYPAGSEHDKEGTVMHGAVTLAGQEFFFMDSAHPGHKFAFNEAVSLMVSCDSQEEIDRYWQALSAVPESEQCGWLKDKYGVSWQIVPASLNTMMQNATEEQLARLTQAFLKMKKFDLAELEKAYQG
jgi:predicted 3-demethylubiquinone-9 3-methyltransferase (glyoxalase superfamily)